MLSLLQKGILYSLEYKSQTALIVTAIIITAATVIIPYLLGSINSAMVVSRIFFGKDIRNEGSGNAGTTNVMRCYGKKAALLTLLGDMLKTVVAILVGGLLMGLYYDKFAFSIGYGGYIAGFFCIVGHIWPIYYGFRGGKGVLCLATMVGVLTPLTLLPLLLIFILIVAFTKYVSLGSVVGGLLYPLLINRMLVFFLGKQLDGIQTVITILAALLIVYCHRTNLSRIMNGKENKFSFHSKKDKECADAAIKETDE